MRTDVPNEQLETALVELLNRNSDALSHPDMTWITSNPYPKGEPQRAQRISAFVKALLTGRFPELPPGR